MKIETPPLPYGHVVIDGETVDLTAIEKPFGLLSEAVQQALLDHGGPYEMLTYSGQWLLKEQVELKMGAVIRVRPKPEPERRTLTLYGNGKMFNDRKGSFDTLRITTTLTDGQWPLGTFVNQDGQTIVVEAEG